MPNNININIKIEGMDRLAKALERFPSVSVKHLNDGIKKSMYEIEREAKPRTPVDTGRLRSSFRTELKMLIGTIGPTVDYAVGVHEGQPAHWPNWRPGSPLAAWARRKRIPAFLVARKISKVGTNPKPFLLEGAKAAIPNIQLHFEMEFSAMMKKIEKIM